MAIAGKDADNGVVEFQFYKPDNRTKWETFQKAIYDKSSNQFLGRTPKSWGQLLLFYSIFYIVLAALFAICMQGLFATLEERQPKWKLDESMIGVNPGLGFRPISNKTEEGSLIWYNITNSTTTDKWVNFVDTFLEDYNKNQSGPNFVKCEFGKPPKENEVCQTTPADFGNCSSSRTYGYKSLSPCVFLKLNRIINWVPNYTTSPHKDMPTKLYNHIKELNETNSTERRVWVSCNGVTEFDKENIKDFNYSPPGFASYYYPFKNVKNYLSPIVAVELVDVTPNVVIQVECRSWAENIKYIGGTLNRAGSVTFEIQVDSESPKSKTNKLKDAKSQAVPTRSSLVDATKSEPTASATVNSAASVTPSSTSAAVNVSPTTATTA